MKTIIYIFSWLLLFVWSYNLKAQEVDNPQEELIDNEWYLKKIVLENEDYYFISDDFVEQAILDISSNEGNDLEGLIMEANFCESVSAQFMFLSENELVTNYMPFGVLAKNNDWTGNCDMSAPPLSEDEFFITEGLYCYEFWNNNMIESDDHPDYPFHYSFEIQETDSFKTLVLINDSGIEAHYQSVPLMPPTVDNPPQELANKTWYLTKMVMNEEDIPFTPTGSLLEPFLIIGPIANNNTSEINFEDSEDQTSIYLVANDEFYMDYIYYLASYKNQNYRTFNDANFDYGLYFFEFWFNHDLEYLQTSWIFPFHFTYTIYQYENYQMLIVVNENGDEVHYQDVPYMSVDKNEIIKLNIYPNPMKESFQVENLTEKSNLKIYDLSGKEILQQEIHSSTESVDVSQLSSGLYFYGIFQDGSRVKTGKLVKQ